MTFTWPLACEASLPNGCELQKYKQNRTPFHPMDLKLFRQTCFTVGTSQMYIPHLLSAYAVFQDLGFFCVFQTHASPIVYATFERGATCVTADCKYQFCFSILLTFIRTHRKSHTKELWGLLGPRDLVLYSCSIFLKKDDFIPLGSQKTPRVPFKVNFTLLLWTLSVSYRHLDQSRWVMGLNRHELHAFHISDICVGIIS